MGLSGNQWRDLREGPKMPGMPEAVTVKSERGASEARGAGALTHVTQYHHIHCGHRPEDCRASLGPVLGDALVKALVR
jgi:hypothetical protein